MVVAAPPPPVASIASTMTSNGNSSLANIVASALAQQETGEGDEAEPLGWWQKYKFLRTFTKLFHVLPFFELWGKANK